MSDNGNEAPKAREILLRATSRAGLQEDDPLYAVVRAQAELFENAMSARDQVHHAEDIEAARAEITQLAQTVRGIGESTAKLERRFSLVGETLGKIEDRVKSLDETTTVFAGVARHQLLWLCAAVFTAGALFLPVAQTILDWIRGLIHL